jgi:hypothetical protein
MSDLAAIKDAPKPSLRATALQILGKLALRREEAIPSARENARRNLSSPHPVVRSRATMVLGWIGERKDRKSLESLLANDADEEVRSMAKTQLQMLKEKFGAQKNLHKSRKTGPAHSREASKNSQRHK